MESLVDERRGYFVNHDLASCKVPVRADVPHLDAVVRDETDPMSSPRKATGVAEPGIGDVAAAGVSAICNATGVRMRDDPITPGKLPEKLPATA